MGISRNVKKPITALLVDTQLDEDNTSCWLQLLLAPAAAACDFRMTDNKTKQSLYYTRQLHYYNAIRGKELKIRVMRSSSRYMWIFNAQRFACERDLKRDCGPWLVAWRLSERHASNCMPTWEDFV